MPPEDHVHPGDAHTDMQEPQPVGVESGTSDGGATGLDLADRYRMLVEHTPDAICVHQHGLLVYINPAGLRFLRAQTPQQILGRPITDFIAPESVGPMLARITTLERQGAFSDPSEATVVALDGTTIAMEAVSVRTSWNAAPAFQVILRDLTDHNAARAAISHQAALVTHVSDAIIAIDTAGKVTSWNPAAATLYGRTAEQMIGMQVCDAVGAPCDAAAVVAAGGRIRDTHRTATGAPVPVAVSAAQMPDGYVLVCADRGAEHRAEAHFTAVVESLEEGVVVLDHRGRIRSANLAAKTFLDIQAGLDTAGAAHSLPFTVHDIDGGAVGPYAHPVAVARRTGAPSTAVLGVVRRRDERRYWLSVTATILDPRDAASSIVVSFVDISEAYRTRMALEHAATHDHLTGLPNRAKVLARLDSELRSPTRTAPVTVLFIDVDNFKIVNDNHGHSVGDGVLQEIARRLTHVLPDQCLVGRIGGDEFVCIVSADDKQDHDSQDTRGDVEVDIDVVRAQLALPMHIGADEVTMTASIGHVTVHPGDPRSAFDILRDADLQMYQAKPDSAQTF